MYCSMTKTYGIVIVFLVSLVTLLYILWGPNLLSSASVPRMPCLDGKKSFGVGAMEKLENECQWYFLNYTPSLWESFWYDNIDRFQNNVCETLSELEELNKTILLLQRVIELQNFGRNKTDSEIRGGDKYLSKMVYRQECFDSRTQKPFVKAEIVHLIEPLIGLLRDPFTMCPAKSSSLVPPSLYDGAVVQSKRFILLSISAPIYKHSLQNTLQTFELSSDKLSVKNENVPMWMYQRTKLTEEEHKVNIKYSKNILFDLGSSYFGNWGNDVTASAGLWFYQYYTRFNVKFDRIIAFENSPLDTTAAWEQLPDDVFPIYTLINAGVRESGKFNPWRTLQAVARSYDHVVVKLDIDSPQLENALMNQILNDSSIHSLIDEFLFEHHTTVKEMISSWGHPPGTLKDSYIMFRKMRELGIRMHSWP